MINQQETSVSQLFSPAQHSCSEVRVRNRYEVVHMHLVYFTAIHQLYADIEMILTFDPLSSAIWSYLGTMNTFSDRIGAGFFLPP